MARVLRLVALDAMAMIFERTQQGEPRVITNLYDCRPSITSKSIYYTTYIAIDEVPASRSRAHTRFQPHQIRLGLASSKSTRTTLGAVVERDDWEVGLARRFGWRRVQYNREE